jgi:addiction module RelB/DinJ family antitoxin
MNTVISVRINKDVKNSAQEVAESAGLKLGTIINAYLRQIAATRRIEFYAPEKMSPKLEELITQVEAEINSDGVSQKFENADDFLNDLKK